MMIGSTNSVGAAYGTGLQTEGSMAMGRDEFLRLLVTQLRNQDPMNPLQPHEFASQLASFTSVEQLIKLNEGLVEQTQSIQLDGLMNETLFSASLLGRSVLAVGDRVEIAEDGSSEVRIDVGGEGGSAEIRLFDESGVEVARRDLGTIGSGRQTIALPNDLPAGSYRYEIEVHDADGENVSVTSYTSGTVAGVSFKDGQVLLKLCGAEVALSALVEIEDGGASRRPATSS